MESRSQSDIEETIDRLCHRKMAEAQVRFTEAKQRLDRHVRLVQPLPDGEERSRCLALLGCYALSEKQEYDAAMKEVEELRARLTAAYKAWAHSEK
jgi:hypothetical protein